VFSYALLRWDCLAPTDVDHFLLWRSAGVDDIDSVYCLCLLVDELQSLRPITEIWERRYGQLVTPTVRLEAAFHNVSVAPGRRCCGGSAIFKIANTTLPG
jgi:hypothetical protein